MSANYVARETEYRMTQGWAEGDRAANEWFGPFQTFEGRFDELLHSIRVAGFDCIDLWTAHLNWSWASDAHVEVARGLLGKHGLRVASLAGGFGESADEFARACHLARAVGTSILGGNATFARTERRQTIELLQKHELTLALENHPERSPNEIVAAIGDGGNGSILTAIDTGWYATQGYDPVRAIGELGDLIGHVHLKDVRAPGAHETCLWGRGCVPVEACVRELQRIGYRGAVSVEHEPPDFDPTEECAQMLQMLRDWLGS